MTKKNYLHALGIHPFVLRSREKSTPPHAAVSTIDWKLLQQQVNNCTSCHLHQTRTHAVFGVGNEKAKLMIIGEAPGFYEDKQGEPFVGRAGKLLNEMLKAILLSREEVFIANIIKCRPPNNRDPLSLEVTTCTPYLDQQIKYIQPKLLVAVGRIAAHYLLKNKSSLESLRQKIHIYPDTHSPLIVTYHPAYLLRNLIDKKKAYIDLKFIKKKLQEFSHDNISSPSEQTL